MIKGVHTMFYSSNPEETRAFLRDVLGLPHCDLGSGWLLFDLPEADMGCHPAEPGDGNTPGAHAISFYCDDIEATVKDLESLGVEFTQPVTDEGYGLVTSFRMPGGIQVQLYEPKYVKDFARS